jgi:CRISPR-associated exonuclease Cas4
MNEFPKLEDASAPEPLPLSLLNDYLFCQRRAALKVIEGWRAANEHTVRGDIVHEHADLPGYEVAKGVTLLRALPVFSERLGLSGKCDIVEAQEKLELRTLRAELQGRPLDRLQRAAPHPSPLPIGWGEGEDASANSEVNPAHASVRPEPHAGSFTSLAPVEYKKGKRRQFENDDAQLCAQALCLEEMFKITVERGAVFHAESKRRREVVFTPELRTLTEETIQQLHRLLDSAQVPPAKFKPACEECSLFNICLPRVTSQPASLRRAAERLFEV